MDCTWVMYQKWRNLLFTSWPFAPDSIQRRLPPDVEVDTYDGKAWLSLLPLQMEDLHLRWLPPIPGTSDFPELNLRTYVRVGDRKGVFFFSIDAASCLGALVAHAVARVRLSTSLPIPTWASALALLMAAWARTAISKLPASAGPARINSPMRAIRIFNAHSFPSLPRRSPSSTRSR